MIEKLYHTDDCIETIDALSYGTCNRCLGKNIYHGLNGSEYCLDCFEYGEIREGMKLYRFIRDTKRENHILEQRYSLTSKQVEGSKFLLKCYQHKQTGFLQAVCGAGKTEMTYGVILKALQEGKKVCFVIPRVEVLKEVYIRFQTDFPNTTMKMLSKSSKDYNDASLLFSTPQQLIIFYHEFDLLIIDEVDAFPYANNPLLERLTYKSVKRNGIILYLSATITNQYTSKINNGLIWHFTIPSRHHLLNMPVPKIVKLKSDIDIQNKVIDICQDIFNKNRQVLLFVPTKNDGKKLYELLSKLNFKCHFISSETTNKKRIIKEFRTKIVSIIITTTLLERGVTFEDIDCIVVYADHNIFSKSTLIQISGRVGRKKEYQTGEIILISKSMTLAMKSCKKEIIKMNKRNQIEMQTV